MAISYRPSDAYWQSIQTISVQNYSGSKVRRSLFGVSLLGSVVFHAVDLDDIAHGYDSADDLEGLLIRPFAIHDMRGGLSIDIVSALEEIPDRLERLVECLVRPGTRIPLAFRKVITPPLDDLAVTVICGIAEGGVIILKVVDQVTAISILQRISQPGFRNFSVFDEIGPEQGVIHEILESRGSHVSCVMCG